MKKLMLILVLNVTLLFSPPPTPGTTDPNGRYVRLGKSAGFYLNPDTYHFIFPAIRPEELLEQNAQRQSRPLYILAGSAVGYTITILTWPIRSQLKNLYKGFWRGIYPREDILLIGNFYLAFLLLNMLVLWLSLLLFEKIFLRMIPLCRASEISMILLMVFIVSNQVTKTFFWAVHQQMFTFLTPLVCIYLLMRGSELESPLPFLKMAGVFFLAGLCLLIYGNFLLLLPCLIYSYIMQARQLILHKGWPRIFSWSILLCFIFFIPTLAWIGALQLGGIEYYSFELKHYHQLVWIKESLDISWTQFLQQLKLNTSYFIGTLKDLLIFLGFTLGIFTFSKFRLHLRSQEFQHIALVFFLFFLFFWLLGYYKERLIDTFIPIILCFWIITMKDNVINGKAIFFLSSLALVWHCYVLTSYGPFT